MIDKLISTGYIVRERRDDDRRKVYVKINDGGLLVMSEIDEIHPEFLKFMHKLTDQEARQLSAFLETLRS